MKKFLEIIALFGMLLLSQVPVLFIYSFVQLNQEKHTSFLWWQLVLTLLAFIGTSYFFIYWTRKKEITTWAFQLKGQWGFIFSSVLFCFFVAILGGILLNLTGVENTLNQDSLDNIAVATPPLLMWLLTGVGAPIMEETIFRGGFQSVLFKQHKKLGVFFGTLFFCLVHFPTNLPSVVIYGGIGLVLGLVYYKSERLEASILVHGIYNTVTVLLMYLLTKK